MCNLRNARAMMFFAIFLFSVLFVSAGAEELGDLEAGIELYKAGKYSEAKAIFESLAGEDARGDTAAFYLGKILFIQGDHNKAIKWFKKVADRFESSSEYHLWLARAYGVKAEKASLIKQPFLAKKTKKEFERSVELDPDNITARLGLLQYYLYAPGIVGGSTDKAYLQAEEIKKRDSLQGHRAFALIYEQENNYEKAEQEYLAALDEDSQNLNLRYALGYFYQRNEDYEKAFATFEAILEEYPREMNAWYQVGRTGALSGQNLERAAACLRKYLQSEPEKNNPSFDWAHYRLGMVYQQAGKADSARMEYQAALELNPRHKQAKAALKKLK